MPTPSPYGQQSSPAPYGVQPSYEEKKEYGQNCKTYYETIQVDKCERYNEKVCYTNQHETCQDVADQNCNGIVTSSEARQCFNVTELKCRLQENVQYESVQAVFTVQKCHTITERVCDTVFETDGTNRNDYQCIKVRNSVCSNVDQTLYDKTCRTTTKFECNYNNYAYGSGSGANSGAAGYGAVEEPKDYCKRTQDTQCYNTPRIVNNQVCVPQETDVCQTVINTVPIAKEKQVCRNDEKKVCELEQRAQPKQIKKYVYTTNCKPVNTEVCDNAQTKRLVQQCVPVSRKTCTYSPVERCEDVPKDYCYKVPKKVAKQKCYGAGYENKEEENASYE